MIGYYILPSLMVTLGYKKIERNFTETEISSSNGAIIEVNSGLQKSSGYTLGVAAFAPLSAKIGFYGSFAYGLNFDTNLNDTGFSNEHYNNEYYLGEMGLMYGKQLDGVPLLESASAYVGYRFQALVEEDYQVHESSFGGGGTNTADYTQGFVVGVNLTF